MAGGSTGLYIMYGLPKLIRNVLFGSDFPGRAVYWDPDGCFYELVALFMGVP